VWPAQARVLPEIRRRLALPSRSRRGGLCSAACRPRSNRPRIEMRAFVAVDHVDAGHRDAERPGTAVRPRPDRWGRTLPAADCPFLWSLSVRRIDEVFFVTTLIWTHFNACRALLDRFAHRAVTIRHSAPRADVRGESRRRRAIHARSIERPRFHCRVHRTVDRFFGRRIESKCCILRGLPRRVVRTRPSLVCYSVAPRSHPAAYHGRLEGPLR